MVSVVEVAGAADTPTSALANDPKMSRRGLADHAYRKPVAVLALDRATSGMRDACDCKKFALEMGPEQFRNAD